MIFRERTTVSVEVLAVEKTKWCPACERHLAVDDFNRAWGAHDGRQVYCRTCHRDKYHARKAEQRKEYAARNRARNLAEAGQAAPDGRRSK